METESDGQHGRLRAKLQADTRNNAEGAIARLESREGIVGTRSFPQMISTPHTRPFQTSHHFLGLALLSTM